MSAYVVERREVGWPRYRVVRILGKVGEIQPRIIMGEFLTRRGAERWIESTEWRPVCEVTGLSPCPWHPDDGNHPVVGS